MTQGILYPGLLPQLLGELHLGRKSGFLRLAKGEETVDLDLNEGGILRVCGTQGRESLIEAFSWGGGQYVFMEGPAASPDDEQALDLGLSMVLRDGLGNGAAGAVTHVLGDLDRVLFLTDEDRRALVCTATDHIILGRVDGTRSIRKIIEQVPLPAEETQRSLAVLLCTGVLQARPALVAVEAAVGPSVPEEIPTPRAVVLEEDEEDGEAGEVAEAEGAAEVATAAEPAVEAAAAEVAESAASTESAATADLATETESAELAATAAPTELAATTESAEGAESEAETESAEAAATTESVAEPSAPEVSSSTPEVSVAPAASLAPAAVLEVEGEAAAEPDAPEMAPAPLAVAFEEVVEEALKAVEAVEAAEAAVDAVEPSLPTPAATPAPPSRPESVLAEQAPETVGAPRRDSGDVQQRLDDRVLLEVLGIGKDEMPVDLMDNALVADDVIRRATNMMAGSDPFGAIRLLEAVIPRIYVKEMKREAQVVLARGYTRNPKWVRRGEELLQSVIRDDPSFVGAYFALGTLYKENGLRARAVNMFRKVLELKPDHSLAAAEIRSLAALAPSKKLFGRT